MKKVLTIIFACFVYSCYSQINIVDSLKHQLTLVKKDTSRIQVLIELSSLYRSEYVDSCLITAKQALDLAQQINFTKGELRAIFWLGLANRDKGNYPQAFALALKGLKVAKNHLYLSETAQFYHLLGLYYTDFKDFKNAISNLHIAKKIEEKSGENPRTFSDLTVAYMLSNQIDSALHFGTLSHQKAIQLRDERGLVNSLRNLGRIQFALNNNDKAIDYYWQSYQTWNKINKVENKDGYKSYIYNLVGEVYLKINKIDSSIYFAKEALKYAKVSGQQKRRSIESYSLLVEAYREKKDFKQAFDNLELLNVTRESLYGASNTQAIQTLIAQDQEQQKQIEIDKVVFQSQLKLYALLVGLGVMLLISFIFYRNNRKEKKAKNLLYQQKEEINQKSIELEQSLEILKSTQAQLIQKEKLASLGELTAGIAHEIQNPLNFVNNFSELSVDLAQELNDEIKKSPLAPDGGITLSAKDKEYIDEIIGDLSSNQEKINHHGKRASSIVKGMLEHSRTSTGERQTTDTNALADEYLRLSYHGLRAKDSSFNSDYELIAGDNLPNINVVPQEIGRVLLNLINNAFYAVNERAKQAEADYLPKVTVTTKTLENAIEIRVKDNGNGIPVANLLKIFQPFFTTKPTGEGTGLGLSLSYDIVTKGHGGTLKVVSVEGEGAEFIIRLPV